MTFCTSISRAWLLFVLGSLGIFACAQTQIEDLLVHHNATDLQRRTFPESKSRQTSYHVQLEYPQPAVSEIALESLQKRGWTRCSGPPVGWEQFADISHGMARAETVFQNSSYLRHGDTLLTVAMRYRVGLAVSGAPLDSPGITEHVV